MSDSSSPLSPALLLSVVVLLAAVGGAFYLGGIAGAALVAAVGGSSLFFAFPAAKPAAESRALTPSEVAPLVRSTAESRNEIIGAMAILQQEIRLLQESINHASDAQSVRDELLRVAAEVASLKAAVNASALRGPAPASKSVSPPPFIPSPAPAAKKPVKEEDDDGDFDVAPLSFDDEEEPAPVPVSKSAPAPVAKTPTPAPVAKPAPVFVPEPEPVLETGLEPEDMDDDGDWLTGGLEEDDLVVTKKVDFEAIVKQDALRPKPKIDEEEQRVLREEMEQMADEEDWVGGGLEDRDVKVKKTTVNDALFEKMRAEIEAKRAAKEANVGVRAPARGETALLVNITVPHGTRLFVRGVGPGLDVERGAAMQQAGHGKWQWICPEQGKPCVVTVWENDELQSEGNPIRIPGGFALTVTPTFRRKLRL